MVLHVDYIVSHFLNSTAPIPFAYPFWCYDYPEYADYLVEVGSDDPFTGEINRLCLRSNADEAQPLYNIY